MTSKEKRIADIMKKLNCTEEEAIDVLETDKAIDKGAKPFELTDQQKKVSKQSRQIARKPKEQVNKPKEKIMRNLILCGSSLNFLKHPEQVTLQSRIRNDRWILSYHT